MFQNKPESLKACMPALILTVLAFMLYANTFGNAWTYDDYPVILENPDVKSLANFFANKFTGRPVRELSYLLDYSLFGFSPAGWHIQQIFWHGLNALLIFLLVLRLDGGRFVAWLTSLLFLAHPIQVEVVASIAHRKDSLCLAFCLLALHAYLKAIRPESKRWRWLIVAIACWVVALFTKQVAVVLPAIIVSYELFLLNTDERFLLRHRAGQRLCLLVVMAFIAAISAWFWLGGTEAFYNQIGGPLVKMQHYDDMTASVYYMVVLKSLAFLGMRLFWPDNLAVEYVFPLPESFMSPWVLTSVGAMLLVALCICLFRNRAPFISFGLVWLCAFWFPASNLFWPLSYFAADRYLYTASFGFCLILAWLVSKLVAKSNKLQWGVGLCLVAVLSVLTLQQNQTWKSGITLYENALQVSPTSTHALLGLGIEYMNEGDLHKANELITKASMNFNDTLSIYYLGLVRERMGDINSALRYYRRFIAMNDPRWQRDIMSLKQHLYQKYRIVY